MKIIRKVIVKSDEPMCESWKIELGDWVAQEKVTFIQEHSSNQSGYVYIQLTGANGLIVEIPIHQVAWMFYKDID